MGGVAAFIGSRLAVSQRRVSVLFGQVAFAGTRATVLERFASVGSSLVARHPGTLQRICREPFTGRHLRPVTGLISVISSLVSLIRSQVAAVGGAVALICCSVAPICHLISMQPGKVTGLTDLISTRARLISTSTRLVATCPDFVSPPTRGVSSLSGAVTLIDLALVRGITWSQRHPAPVACIFNFSHASPISTMDLAVVLWSAEGEARTDGRVCAPG